MKHEVFEKNSLILLIGILVVVSIGGIVQIAPLFWVESTIEKVQGHAPLHARSSRRAATSTCARAATAATAR